MQPLPVTGPTEKGPIGVHGRRRCPPRATLAQALGPTEERPVGTFLTRGRSCAFTIVEITIGAAILSLLLGFVFGMFTKSNSMAGKGSWRVSSSNEVRMGLRRLQSIISSTTYPTLAVTTQLAEDTGDPYKINLTASAATTVVASGTNSVMLFTGAAASGRTLLTAWTFLPVTDTAATPTCARYALKFGTVPSAAVTPDARDLILDEEQGSYTMPPAPTPAATPALGALVSKTLIRNVAWVRITVPGTDADRGMISLEVNCVDPIDGRSAHTTLFRMVKNVPILRS